MNRKKLNKKLRNVSLPEVEWTDEGVTLSGRSIPEDAKDFYGPFIKKLRNEISNKDKFVFNFKIEYYNTSSSRYMTTILYILRNHKDILDVQVNWYYLPADELIYELGLDFKEVTGMNVNLIKIKDGFK